MQLKTRTLTNWKRQKKSVTSEFSSKINSSRASITTLSHKINNGYEYREVECEVALNFPHGGDKTITRKDTGGIVRVEEMTKAEKEQELKKLQEVLGLK